jgi:hypothetical protein
LATDIHVGPILNQCYQSKTIRYLWEQNRLYAFICCIFHSKIHVVY